MDKSLRILMEAQFLVQNVGIYVGYPVGPSVKQQVYPNVKQHVGLYVRQQAQPNEGHHRQ